MSLAHIAEQIATSLNTSPPETWSDLSVGTLESDYVEAKIAFDPIQHTSQPVKGLWVIPVMVNYSREASQGRRELVSLYKQPIISICLSIPITTPDTNGIDVGSWEEVKKVLNLREEIDMYVLRQNWGTTIDGITAEPAQEVELKHKWYLSITEIEFGLQSC